MSRLIHRISPCACAVFSERHFHSLASNSKIATLDRMVRLCSARNPSKKFPNLRHILKCSLAIFVLNWYEWSMFVQGQKGWYRGVHQNVDYNFSTLSFNINNHFLGKININKEL